MNWESITKTHRQRGITEVDIMALEKKFSNTVPDKQEQKREITRLTELLEEDKNTIYNLFFADIPMEEAKGEI